MLLYEAVLDCHSLSDPNSHELQLLDLPTIGKSAVTHGLQLFYDRLENKLAFIQLKGFMSKAVS